MLKYAIAFQSTMGEISRGGHPRLFLKVGSGRDLPSRLYSKVGLDRTGRPESQDEANYLEKPG